MLGKPAVAAPVIGDDLGAWRLGTPDEVAGRLGAAVWYQGKSNATGIPPGFALVETAAGKLALTDFESTSHVDYVVDTAPIAARTTTHTGFIGLNGDAGLAANPIIVRSHLAFAKLVKTVAKHNSPRCRWNWTADILGVLLATINPDQKQTESGVRVRFMTIQAVRLASQRHLRQPDYVSISARLIS
jgi:hypothetical protein